MAKFCVIVAAITGEDFFVSIGRSFYTLKGKFSTLFVVDGVAKVVMYSAAAVFSCVLWAFAWFVAAGISGEDTIGYQYTMWGEGTDLVTILQRILLVLLWILAVLLVYYPLIGILVCILWGSQLFGYYFGTSYLIGVFSGALANYLFTFFADVVLDVTTAMFTIVRIDHKNGKKIEGDLSEGSAASIGMYYFKLSGDDTGTELAVQQGTTVHVVVQQPMMAQPIMAQPYNGTGQVMMAQPMMAQPYNGGQMMAQPLMAQPYGQSTMGQPYGQSTMGQPMVYQATMVQPAYGQQPPQYADQPASSDPYDASKPTSG